MIILHLLLKHISIYNKPSLLPSIVSHNFSGDRIHGVLWWKGLGEIRLYSKEQTVANRDAIIYSGPYSNEDIGDANKGNPAKPQAK